VNAQQKQALVYCRMSSVAQALRGNGLAVQRSRCIAYARARNYKIVETFCDTLESDQLERPGFNAMLAFLKRNRQAGLTVLMDDFTRLAREISTQVQLCIAIEEAGGEIDAPGFDLKDEFDFGAAEAQEIEE